MTPLIAVDVGGTFTDVVIAGTEGIVDLKVPTTRDPSEAVVAAVDGVPASAFLHGTTAATNTLLEERGADVALVTDPGFEDLIEIGRQDRPSLYDSSIDRPLPLVPRHRRHWDPGHVGEPEIVAIALLDSYRNPEAEREVARSLGPSSVLSSEVSPEFREYERLATTVLTAYLTPSVAHYLERLDDALTVPSRLVMTSSGGLLPFSSAGRHAGRLVLSGPAGGVVAAAAMGLHHGHRSVISFDMGGTSTDVCRVTDGLPPVAAGHLVGGRVNRVPSIPIRTIGAGGGSIAWFDDGGALRVGPRSAGADPGPAAYGKGGQDLTVTDANLLVGHIPADLELGGSVALDWTAAEAAATRLASEAAMHVDEVVAGVLEVVDAHMERALRAVSVEEGADPRDSALVAFGGAGGLHATRLAGRLGIHTVLIPPHSGVFSALGLLLATPRADAMRTVMLKRESIGLSSALGRVAAEAAESFHGMFGVKATATSIHVDMRYVGQAYELEVDGDHDWSILAERFHTAHEQRFGFARRGEAVEVVNLRGVSTGDPPLTWDDLPPIGVGSTPLGDDGLWRRETLPEGFTCTGPAVVVEANSATLLTHGDTLTVLHDGTLEIRCGDGAR